MGEGRPQRSHSEPRPTLLATQSRRQRHEKRAFKRPILGLTLGYQLNDNLNLTVGYRSTLNSSSDPTALRMDNFMLTLVYGWHPLIEGSRRLKSE